MREFDGDPSVIGRSIRVADGFVQIVGVAPPLFEGIERPRPAGPRRMGVGRPRTSGFRCGWPTGVCRSPPPSSVGRNGTSSLWVV